MGDIKRNLIKRDWDESAGSLLSVEWPDGEKTSYDVAALGAETRLALSLHGANQKLFDSLAGDTKAGVSFADQRKTVQAIWDNLVSGEWGTKRGTSEGPRLSLLAQAVSRMLDKPIEKVKAHLETLTVEQRRALSADEKIKAIIAKIQLENAEAKAAAATGAGESLAGVAAALESL